jgi:pimeloyl-ACP methyl ester carboxylesterase
MHQPLWSPRSDFANCEPAPNGDPPGFSACCFDCTGNIGAQVGPLDRLRDEAPRFRLDPGRAVLVGHSAGGHLALWAAARGKLPAGSSVGASAPFVPGAVISLAGIGDLKDFGRFVPILCGPGVSERLMPPATEAETSPAAMAAPDVP